MNILSEVSKVINGERQDAYGAPEDSFQIIADYWNVYIANKFVKKNHTVHFRPEDIARMMTLFKLARMHGQKFSRDNWRDAIGYLTIEVDRLIECEEISTDASPKPGEFVYYYGDPGMAAGGVLYDKKNLR